LAVVILVVIVAKIRLAWHNTGKGRANGGWIFQGRRPRVFTNTLFRILRRYFKQNFGQNMIKMRLLFEK